MAKHSLWGEVPILQHNLQGLHGWPHSKSVSLSPQGPHQISVILNDSKRLKPNIPPCLCPCRSCLSTWPSKSLHSSSRLCCVLCPLWSPLQVLLASSTPCPQPSLPFVLIPLSEHLVYCLEVAYLLIHLHIWTVSSWLAQTLFSHLPLLLPVPSRVTSTWWVCKYLLNDHEETNDSITLLPLNILSPPI